MGVKTMKHLLFALVVAGAVFVLSSAASAQCGYTSYYQPYTTYYAAPAVAYAPAYSTYYAPRAYYGGYRYRAAYAPSYYYYGW